MPICVFEELSAGPACQSRAQTGIVRTSSNAQQTGFVICLQLTKFLAQCWSTRHMKCSARATNMQACRASHGSFNKRRSRKGWQEDGLRLWLTTEASAKQDRRCQDSNIGLGTQHDQMYRCSLYSTIARLEHCRLQVIVRKAPRTRP